MAIGTCMEKLKGRAFPFINSLSYVCIYDMALATGSWGGKAGLSFLFINDGKGS